MSTEKSLGAVLTETKTEMKEFIETRLQLIHSEIIEKLRIWKHSVPLLLLAGGLLLMGWIVLTFAVVAAIHALFLPSDYAWVWAGLVVSIIYLGAGGTVGWFAYGAMRAAGVTLKRTMQVLKQDQIWIQNETRAA